MTSGVDRIQLRVKPATTSDPGGREEREQLVYEEYDTEEHEVLAIVLENQSASVGVSLFLSDREVEYHCIIMIMMLMTDDDSDDDYCDDYDCGDVDDDGDHDDSIVMMMIMLMIMMMMR